MRNIVALVLMRNLSDPPIIIMGLFEVVIHTKAVFALDGYYEVDTIKIKDRI